MDIIRELNSSLDLEAGGQLADTLRNLYSFFERRLLESNCKKSRKGIDEVIPMLKQLRDAWFKMLNGQTTRHAPGRRRRGRPANWPPHECRKRTVARLPRMAPAGAGRDQGHSNPQLEFAVRLPSGHPGLSITGRRPDPGNPRRMAARRLQSGGKGAESSGARLRPAGTDPAKSKPSANHAAPTPAKSSISWARPGRI